ncbi:MAG: hypothetical protein GY750_17075 [Lentisphaerae bacterium]|nr:hypothetical protein [Lentisphaerota bacterium]MCP4103110.1 hypothetical protein [Lentisphaerota bacterium]
MNKKISRLQHKLHNIIDKTIKGHNKINEAISEVYYDNFRVLDKDYYKKDKRNIH